MRMITRSSIKRSSDSWNSDVSEENIIPPWCTSGRGHGDKRGCIKSACSKENIWSYVNDKNFKGKSGKKFNKQTLVKSSKNRNAKLLIISLALSLIFGLLLSHKSPKTYFVSFLSKSKMLSLPECRLIDECCDKMSHLTLQLNRAERALRNTLRLRRAMLISQNTIREPLKQGQYIAGARVTIGSTTTEWGGRVTLWGVVPLWRASPPPDTVLALRPPTPTDCWSFRGSSGELIIHLPKRHLVATVSVEHVRPDTTRSAPKHFTLYGILENGTWVKSTNGEYSYSRPSKQYFSLQTKNVPLKQVALRVLSNQGNTKYTCIYRVHLYSSAK